MRKDFFDLKIGNDIYQVDYDHSTGKFTQKNEIKAKKNIILCGLHTLHDKKIVNNMNLNIYLDPDINIKKYWKIERDIKKRNYTIDQVLSNIKKRESDYKKYIDPQKNNADMIIRFYNIEEINYLEMIKNNQIINYGLKLLFKEDCISNFSNLLNKYKINYEQGVESKNGNFYYYINFKNTIEKKYLLEFINENKITIKLFEDGYFFIIQIFIILYLRVKKI
jgi:hypothetical protein